jgi:hypothetical protein
MQVQSASSKAGSKVCPHEEALTRCALCSSSLRCMQVLNAEKLAVKLVVKVVVLRAMLIKSEMHAGLLPALLLAD